jgi:hypothetical protein
MQNEPLPDFDDILDLLDLGAIADPGDKVRECEFFLALASVEHDRERFRWLISAYLNAVYSFFETSALRAYVGITDPKTGDPVGDAEALETLRAYVKVFQDAKNPYFVKTGGLDPTIQRLYKSRAAATHHVPLSIMAAGPNLPEDFHFGDLRGRGEPILPLCRQALVVVKQVEEELNS